LVRVIVLALLAVISVQMTALAKDPVIARYGMSGGKVAAIQQYLIQAGFLQGSADGVFGTLTLDAVKKFQKAVKLKNDGVVETRTMEALKNYRPSAVNRAGARPGLPAGQVIARRGMRGGEVKNIQQYLARGGFLQGPVDGIFGQATFQAVKDFQKAVGIKADGVVNAETLAALQNYRPVRSRGPRTASVMPSRSMQPGAPNRWRSISMEATAYTRYDAGCTNYTYRGNYLRRGLVAVDPAVIPLGTRLYIPEYGYAVADDIGSAIKGNKIDLAMETRDEAFAFGRRNVTVYIMGA
jgi:3D (Asp-Asp-Asp) domain-containing protein/peptidoglycan hydrolase-like protein with peptidoglycan-binding domain